MNTVQLSSRIQSQFFFCCSFALMYNRAMFEVSFFPRCFFFSLNSFNFSVTFESRARTRASISSQSLESQYSVVDYVSFIGYLVCIVLNQQKNNAPIFSRQKLICPLARSLARSLFLFFYPFSRIDFCREHFVYIMN